MSHTHYTLWHVFIGPLAAIYGRSTTRMSKVYAVGVQYSYYNKFNMLLMYCTYYSIDVNNITVDHVITFLEFLAGSGLSTPTILTYISAVKSKYSQFGIPSLPWSHPRVNIMLRSCSRTIMNRPDPKQVLNPQTLTHTASTYYP